MNRIKMYSFFDKKSEIYDTPFFSQTDIQAKRHFNIVGNKQDTIIGTFLSEFELYFIGEFSHDTGKMEIIEKPKLIMSGNQIVNERHTEQRNQLKLFETATQRREAGTVRE